MKTRIIAVAATQGVGTPACARVGGTYWPPIVAAVVRRADYGWARL